MGAGAGQTGGMPQQMPQMMAMPAGAPTQSGLGALAAQMQQTGQADPRLMAAMQAFQQQGGMPGAGMMPPGGMPTQQTQQAMMDQIRQTSPAIGMPGMPMPQVPGMAAPGGGLLPGAQLQYDPRKPGGMIPGGVPVQRPLPVGAGGKGAGMPRPTTPKPTPRPMTPRPAGFTGFR